LSKQREWVSCVDGNVLSPAHGGGEHETLQCSYPYSQNGAPVAKNSALAYNGTRDIVDYIASAIVCGKEEAKEGSMLSREISQVLYPLYKFRLFVVFVSAAHILIGLLPPYFMGLLIDDLYQYSGAPIYYVIGTIAGLLLLYFFLDWLQGYLWADMINRGAGIVRSFLFSHVLHKDYNFFLKHSEGDISSKVINDAYLYAQARLARMPTLLLNLLHIIVILIIFAVLINFGNTIKLWNPVRVVLV
jgi:ABC-type bacteriocin/lantibiotic exporter with double-glycine peptidase domain